VGNTAGSAEYSRCGSAFARGNKIVPSAVFNRAMVHLAGGAAHWRSRGDLAGPDKFDRFEDAILPHLDAAYNLARWLMRDDHEAQDAVQDAYLRALRFFSGFRGGDGRVWLLSIVRNTCFSRMRSGRARKGDSEFDEQMHAIDDSAANPETLLLRSQDEASLRRALESLPTEFREVIVMRELEGLSYKEIADVAELPIGTVMSRLARARKRLAQLLTGEGSG
jgi:RNA polymerase sigma factor (sigma-70 family)